MAAPPRIAVDSIDGISVIHFLDRQLYDDRAVREVVAQLDQAVASAGSPIRLILDFSGVAMVSSALIGRMVLLQRRVDASNGMMRLCDLSKAVRDVLRTTNLDRVLKIDRDRRESRDAFGPAR